MPVITFPKGPNTQEEPETDNPLETGEVNYYLCPHCSSTAFSLFDDGEVECANPRCGVMPNLMVVDLGNGDTDASA